MEYKKFDLRSFVNHDEPTWVLPGYIIWKRKKNMLAVFPQQITRKNWRHLLDNSRTVRRHVYTKRGQSSQHELEAIIRAGYNFGTFDIQQYFVNRLKGKARFGNFISTVRIDGKHTDWNPFQSTKKQTAPVYHPYQPIKTTQKQTAHHKFLAEKRVKTFKKYSVIFNNLKRVQTPSHF